MAIVLGIFLGGWYPSGAVHTKIFGEIFLNALKMIVVPLVIFSLLSGITGLGDIRNLGSIGRRTITYYMITTLIAVIVGIILVNIIQPGKGIAPGETHSEAVYRISGEKNRTITLQGVTWKKNNYEKGKYTVTLLDQNLQGLLLSQTDNTAVIKLWSRMEEGEVYHLKSEEGTRLPFQRVDRVLVSQEPLPQTTGKGIRIDLPLAEKVKGKEGKGAGQTLKEVFVGEGDKQGMIPSNLFKAMTNMDILPLIVFSLLLGAALTIIPAAKGVIEGINILNEAIMKIVHWIMILAPIGILGLVASRIGEAGGFAGFLPELLALGKYAFTVLLGLFLHGILVLGFILWKWGKRNPLTYVRGMATALLNAFSTASSSATLPLTLEGVEEENGVSNRTASFVLPLGATINMDGTALYEAVAALFIAQAYGIVLGFPDQLVIVLTATLASIGAAGIPEAGLVTMVIVLRAVGLPIEGIGLLLSIDWLLDRFRTTINVWGDAVGAAVIEEMELRGSR